MGKRATSLSFAAAAVLLASTAASACGTGDVLLDDTFQSLASTWGFVDQDDTRSNGVGGISYKLSPGNSIFLMNSASAYDDYETCASFKVGRQGDDSLGYSVLFWLADNRNYYGASVTPRYGKFQVFRYQRGRYLQQNNWKEDDAINKGDDAENEISVTARGRHMTLTINGKTVFELDGQPPPDGSLVGFDMFAGNTNKADQTGTLIKYQVREVR